MNQNISSPNAEDNPNSKIVENSTDSQVDQSKTGQVHYHHLQIMQK
ncbi:hypothetical protein NK318_04960 [Acinetobacter junii]